MDKKEAIRILKNFVSEMTQTLQDKNKKNRQYASEVFWKNKDSLELIIAMLERPRMKIISLNNEPCHEVYKSTNEPLIGGALLGGKRMTEEKINELKAKAFDLIVKSNNLFLDEDGNVHIGQMDFLTKTYPIVRNVTDAEHSFLSLVMSESYELAEGEIEISEEE